MTYSNLKLNITTQDLEKFPDNMKVFENDIIDMIQYFQPFYRSEKLILIDLSKVFILMNSLIILILTQLIC